MNHVSTVHAPPAGVISSAATPPQTNDLTAVGDQHEESRREQAPLAARKKVLRRGKPRSVGLTSSRAQLTRRQRSARLLVPVSHRSSTRSKGSDLAKAPCLDLTAPTKGSEACQSGTLSLLGADRLNTASAGASDGGTSSFLDVYVVGRPFTEWGGKLIERLPPGARAHMLDVGVCHYMAVFRDPDGGLLQLDFGPKGGDVRKAWPPKPLAAAASSLLRWPTIRWSPSQQQQQPTMAQDATATRWERMIRPLVKGGKEMCVEGAAARACTGDIAAVSADAAPAAVSAIAAASEVVPRSSSRSDAGVVGEIRECKLSELPVAHLYVGRTYRSMDDVAAFNKGQALCYQLHRNDCRHYVNGLVHFLTGMPSSTSYFKRHHYRSRLKSVWAWHTPLVALTQAVTDVGAWERICATGKASAAAALVLHSKHLLPQLGVAAQGLALPILSIPPPPSPSAVLHHLPTMGHRAGGGGIAASMLKRSVTAVPALGAVTAAAALKQQGRLRQLRIHEAVFRARTGFTSAASSLSKSFSNVAQGVATATATSKRSLLVRINKSAVHGGAGPRARGWSQPAESSAPSSSSPALPSLLGAAAVLPWRKPVHPTVDHAAGYADEERRSRSSGSAIGWVSAADQEKTAVRCNSRCALRDGGCDDKADGQRFIGNGNKWDGIVRLPCFQLPPLPALPWAKRLSMIKLGGSHGVARNGLVLRP